MLVVVNECEPARCLSMTMHNDAKCISTKEISGGHSYECCPFSIEHDVTEAGGQGLQLQSRRSFLHSGKCHKRNWSRWFLLFLRYLRHSVTYLWSKCMLFLLDDEIPADVERNARDFGGNMDRLIEIKKKYDPDNLFRKNENLLSRTKAKL